jgi:hypothetical protein
MLEISKVMLMLKLGSILRAGGNIVAVPTYLSFYLETEV